MALTYDQLTATTVNDFIKKVVDNVYNSRNAVKRLMRPAFVRLKSGGNKIQGTVINSAPGAGGRWYSGSDTLLSPETDNLTSYEFDWKQIQEPIRISGLDMRVKNAGEAAKINLMIEKMKIAELNLSENLGAGIFSDGTAYDSKIITGLQALMSETTTYGGIAVADMATWKANIVDNSSVDRPLTLNLMQQAYGAASIDSMQPTVGMCNQNVYDQAWALYTPAQRIINEENAKLGFKSLEFNGIALCIDSHMKAKSIYFLNEEHVFLVIHNKTNMITENLDVLESFDGILKRILWAGNLVCDSRRLHSELADIAVAA